MSEAERAAMAQQAQRESSMRTWYMEIGCDALIIAYISLNIIVYHTERNCGDFQIWLAGSLLIYTFDMINNMNQLL